MKNETLVPSKTTTMIYRKLRVPKPTEVYNTYWKFAAERQAIFFRRLNHAPFPWTKDPILKKYKFTNAYRATDRVSQYLIRNVLYSGEQAADEVLFRILVFKIFNKIETWELLSSKLGRVVLEDYTFDRYHKVLQDALNKEQRIYSSAYIMASGRSFFGYERKHQNHLKLIEKIMNDGASHIISQLPTMEKLYQYLLNYPSIGSFLAYQYAIDINYSSLTDFTEMEFVKAGPGAKDGIRKCFSDLGDYSEEDIIKMMADNQDREFARLEIDFQKLWGRPLQLIDCQNLFCEVDKYSRIAHPDIQGISDRKRIKQKFTPTSLKPIDYYFPPKWGLNLSTTNTRTNG